MQMQARAREAQLLSPRLRKYTARRATHLFLHTRLPAKHREPSHLVIKLNKPYRHHWPRMRGGGSSQTWTERNIYPTIGIQGRAAPGERGVMTREESGVKAPLLLYLCLFIFRHDQLTQAVPLPHATPLQRITSGSRHTLAQPSPIMLNTLTPPRGCPTATYIEMAYKTPDHMHRGQSLQHRGSAMTGTLFGDGRSTGRERGLPGSPCLH